MNGNHLKPLIKQNIKRTLGLMIFLTLLPLLWIFELLYPLRLGAVIVHRIGHLLNEPDLFLRRCADGQLPTKPHYIFFATAQVCNTTALALVKRHVTLFHGRFYAIFFALIRPHLEKTRFYVAMFEPTVNYETYLGLYTKPSIPRNYFWTAEQEKMGMEALRTMGMSETDWFICFHCRDASYLKAVLPKNDWNYHNVRDSSIKSYFKAAQYIVEQNGFAVRMGAIVEEPLEKSLHTRIIDYATRYRSDFLDLYLTSKCKFFLGSNSGLFAVPATFEVPLSYANGSPATVPWGKFSMLIPQKLWHRKENRWVGFREAFFTYGINTIHGAAYERAQITPVSNTEDEILDLCIEMNEIVSGKRTPDRELNDMVRKNMGVGHPWRYMTSYIGSNFIKNNIDLFQ